MTLAAGKRLTPSVRRRALRVKRSGAHLRVRSRAAPTLASQMRAPAQRERGQPHSWAVEGRPGALRAAPPRGPPHAPAEALLWGLWGLWVSRREETAVGSRGLLWRWSEHTAAGTRARGGHEAGDHGPFLCLFSDSKTLPLLEAALRVHAHNTVSEFPVTPGRGTMPRKGPPPGRPTVPGSRGRVSEAGPRPPCRLSWCGVLCVCFKQVRRQVKGLLLI